MDKFKIIKKGNVSEEKLFKEELFSRWVSYVDASPRTVETYSKAIKQFIYYIRRKGILEPVRGDIVLYRESLKEKLKPTTVQSYLTAVKLFFQWTDLEGLYPDVAKRVKGAKLERNHKKDYLTTKQVRRLLETVDRGTFKGKRDYAMLCTMVTTGLRTISISRANVEDIGKVGDNIVLYYQGKGREEKAEYVKLSGEVEEALRDYMKGMDKGEKRGALFISTANRNRGERMTTRSISRVAKRYLVEVGLESDRHTAHSLRHTAATLNLLNGGTVEETQQLLGHTDINTTLIYSHALEREKNNSEERISKAIFG